MPINDSVILVPHLNGIEPECEQGLKGLEKSGIEVRRYGGASAIDVVRNQLASDALHDGFKNIFFIDADIGFDCLDAIKLLKSDELVICGLYPKKGIPEITSVFDKNGSLLYAATGFLRIKAIVLDQLIEKLELPLCNTAWGRGSWPFFQPLIVKQPNNRFHYLGEDWAFSYRLRQIGIIPKADTSIKLTHWGRYGYKL